MLALPSLYQKWFTTIMRLTFFILSYLVSGILFHFSFQAQMLLLFRIILLLGITQFLVQTSSKSTVVNSANATNKSISNLLFFLRLTLYFMPLLMHQFKQEFKKSKSIVSALEASLQNCMKKPIVLPASTHGTEAPFYSFPNLIIMIYLLLLILLGSI